MEDLIQEEEDKNIIICYMPQPTTYNKCKKAGFPEAVCDVYLDDEKPADEPYPPAPAPKPKPPKPPPSPPPKPTPPQPKRKPVIPGVPDAPPPVLPRKKSPYALPYVETNNVDEIAKNVGEGIEAGIDSAKAIHLIAKGLGYKPPQWTNRLYDKTLGRAVAGDYELGNVRVRVAGRHTTGIASTDDPGGYENIRAGNIGISTRDPVTGQWRQPPRLRAGVARGSQMYRGLMGSLQEMTNHISENPHLSSIAHELGITPEEAATQGVQRVVDALPINARIKPHIKQALSGKPAVKPSKLQQRRLARATTTRDTELRPIQERVGQIHSSRPGSSRQHALSRTIEERGMSSKARGKQPMRASQIEPGTELSEDIPMQGGGAGDRALHTRTAEISRVAPQKSELAKRLYQAREARIATEGTSAPPIQTRVRLQQTPVDTRDPLMQGGAPDALRTPVIDAQRVEERVQQMTQPNISQDQLNRYGRVQRATNFKSMIEADLNRSRIARPAHQMASTTRAGNISAQELRERAAELQAEYVRAGQRIPSDPRTFARALRRGEGLGAKLKRMVGGLNETHDMVGAYNAQRAVRVPKPTSSTQAASSELRHRLDKNLQKVRTERVKILKSNLGDAEQELRAVMREEPLNTESTRVAYREWIIKEKAAVAKVYRYQVALRAEEARGDGRAILGDLDVIDIPQPSTEPTHLLPSVQGEGTTGGSIPDQISTLQRSVRQGKRLAIQRASAAEKLASIAEDPMHINAPSGTYLTGIEEDSRLVGTAGTQESAAANLANAALDAENKVDALPTQAEAQATLATENAPLKANLAKANEVLAQQMEADGQDPVKAVAGTTVDDAVSFEASQFDDSALSDAVNAETRTAWNSLLEVALGKGVAEAAKAGDISAAAEGITWTTQLRDLGVAGKTIEGVMRLANAPTDLLAAGFSAVKSALSSGIQTAAQSAALRESGREILQSSLGGTTDVGITSANIGVDAASEAGEAAAEEAASDAGEVGAVGSAEAGEATLLAVPGLNVADLAVMAATAVVGEGVSLFATAMSKAFAGTQLPTKPGIMLINGDVEGVATGNSSESGVAGSSSGGGKTTNWGAIPGVTAPLNDNSIRGKLIIGFQKALAQNQAILNNGGTVLQIPTSKLKTYQTMQKNAGVTGNYAAIALTPAQLKTLSIPKGLKSYPTPAEKAQAGMSATAASDGITRFGSNELVAGGSFPTWADTAAQGAASTQGADTTASNAPSAAYLQKVKTIVTDAGTNVSSTGLGSSYIVGGTPTDLWKSTWGLKSTKAQLAKTFAEGQNLGGSSEGTTSQSGFFNVLSPSTPAQKSAAQTSINALKAKISQLINAGKKGAPPLYYVVSNAKTASGAYSTHLVQRLSSSQLSQATVLLSQSAQENKTKNGSFVPTLYDNIDPNVLEAMGISPFFGKLHYKSNPGKANSQNAIINGGKWNNAGDGAEFIANAGGYNPIKGTGYQEGAQTKFADDAAQAGVPNWGIPTAIVKNLEKVYAISQGTAPGTTQQNLNNILMGNAVGTSEADSLNLTGTSTSGQDLNQFTALVATDYGTLRNDTQTSGTIPSVAQMQDAVTQIKTNQAQSTQTAVLDQLNANYQTAKPGSDEYIQGKYVAEMYAYNHLLDPTSAEPLPGWVMNPTQAQISSQTAVNPIDSILGQEKIIMGDSAAAQAAAALIKTETTATSTPAQIAAAKAAYAAAEAKSSTAQADFQTDWNAYLSAVAAYNKNISANNVDINAYNQHLHSVITQGVQSTQAAQTSLYNAMEGGKSGGLFKLAGLQSQITKSYSALSTPLEKKMTAMTEPAHNIDIPSSKNPSAPASAPAAAPTTTATKT